MITSSILPKISTPFKSGDIIENRYTLIEQISAGSYGTIFEAFHKNRTSTQHVAIKFENTIHKSPKLPNEIFVLQALTDHKHFARFFQQGINNMHKFVAMELLGPCLIDLVNRKKTQQFCLHSLLKLGVQSIEALQALHKAGFVHRDINPSNFVIGCTVETSSKIYLIDFGLCKKLNVKDGIVVMPSMKGSFRGTIKYASINAHLKKELGRNDDLMSLIYIFVELYTGSIPWGNINDTDEVLRLKEHYQGGNLLANMPPELMQFERHILSLNYTTEPDYQLLTSILDAADEKHQKIRKTT
ncbi:MAG: putative Tau-tubulin kinase 2 [Streblomastix strix]|uniref:Putative Tau-tubulin kinase 2 n=1 Tax=Streblomastix strix TaxID=222440 RepID=A0A5J4VZ66_9EUKA|nr:MAG: putative Tau-tubulin kinase 2 [Streblomastix strix]